MKGQKGIQNQVRQEIDSNRNLSLAFRFAEGEEKSRIEDFKRTLFEKLQKKVVEAQKQEEETRNRLKQKYEAFLKETDQKVQARNSSACAEREKAYQKACNLQQRAQTVQDYQTAIAAFESISGYQDVDQRVKQCQNSIAEIQETEREERERQEQQKKKDEERAAKKRKKTISIIVAVLLTAAALAAFVILVFTVILPQQKLNKAMELLDTGDYEVAYTLLDEIGDYETIASSKYDRAMEQINIGDYDSAILLLEGLHYKDSEEKVEKYYIDKYGYGQKEYKLINAQIGDSFVFGTYEQDNNTANGKENIEWIVLDKDGASLLLLSKYAIDCRKYHRITTSVTWEKCSLRKWLNETFRDEAFTQEEQAMIPTVMVSADENPKYSTSPGNSTQDQIFLLSILEANKYFSSNDERRCKPTAYAKAEGCTVNFINGDCSWWLRSPGATSSIAADVSGDGSVFLRGYSVTYGTDAVRPALWINLAS